MLLFKLFLVSGLIAVGTLSVEAADMEMRIVDKDCWVEIFEDSNFDADDPHFRIQGPKEIVSMKNLMGKDWANDIESIVVGPSAAVQAYEDWGFTSTMINFVPGQRVPDLGKHGMANDIESMRVTCGK